MDDRRKNDDNQSLENSSLKPDQETLHTPDPQENMEGPVSSTVHKTGEAFDTTESKQEADKRREENM